MDGYKGTKIDVGWWETQAGKGVEFRREVAKEAKWDQWRRYYRNEYSSSQVPSNLFFKLARSVIPRVYFRNPTVSVSPTKPGLEQIAFALLLGRIDNKILRSMRMKKRLKKIVQDTFFFGTGLGKLGFGAQYQPSPTIDGDTQDPLTSQGHRVEYHADVFPNMPWFMRVHPSNFIVPSGTMDIESTPWVAEIIKRPLDDVRRDPRFINTSDLRGGKNTSFIVTQDGKWNRRPSVPIIELYEIRDKRTNRVFIIAPEATDKVLFEDYEVIERRRGFPYYDLVFNPDDEHFWGIPDSVNIEPQQLEINEIRKYQAYHRRMSIIKWIARKGVFDPHEKEVMLNTDPMTMVEIDGEPLSDIVPKEMADIPEGLIKMEAILTQDLRETVGFGPNQQGNYAPTSADRTAHEAEIVRMASELRLDEKRDEVADLLQDVIEDTNELIFNFWKQEIVVDVMGPQGVPIWVKFRPQVLSGGQYEVQIDADSSVPETRPIREQRAEKVYTIMKQNPLVNQVALLQYFFAEHQKAEFDVLLNAGMLTSPTAPMGLPEFQSLLGQTGTKSGGGGNADVLRALNTSDTPRDVEGRFG